MEGEEEFRDGHEAYKVWERVFLLFKALTYMICKSQQERREGSTRIARSLPS